MLNYEIDNHTVVKEENVLILRKHRLKLLGIKATICVTYPQIVLGKISTLREKRKQMGLNINNG